MSEGLMLAVIAGLATGIAFVALFGSFFGPPTPTEQSVSIEISDFGFTTYFLFSDVEAKVLNFTVDWETSSILMTVDVPQDTELRIRFYEHLFENLERQQRPEEYRFGDTYIVFVDEEEEKVTWEYTELEVIATIPLEADAKIIDIVPISLVS